MNKKFAISLIVFTLFATVSAGRGRLYQKKDRFRGLERVDLKVLNYVYGEENVNGMSPKQLQRALKALRSATPEEIAATIDRRKKK